MNTNMSQLDMFGFAAPEASGVPAIETIRHRLDGILNMLRIAQELPWTPAETRSWALIVPQMTNWLPEPEAQAVRAEFAAEMERLQAKAA